MSCTSGSWCNHSKILCEKYTLLGVPDHEDNAITVFRNVGNCLPNHTASTHRNFSKNTVTLACDFFPPQTFPYFCSTALWTVFLTPLQETGKKSSLYHLAYNAAMQVASSKPQETCTFSFFPFVPSSLFQKETSEGSASDSLNYYGLPIRLHYTRQHT
jgi:hypothetical protein